jgi:hypothetical protein
MPQKLASKAGDPDLEVAIISDNPETLDGLREYLEAAGITTYGSRQLEAPLLMSRPLAAVVLFPDDFSIGDVLDLVTRLLRARPNVRALIVTGDPRRYEPLVASHALSTGPMIIPKPAWGWTILESIRADLAL